MINRRRYGLVNGLLITALALGMAALATAYADQWSLDPGCDITTDPGGAIRRD